MMNKASVKRKPTFYGINPPFIGGPQNILSRQEYERLIKNDILQLLLTVPGERVMRPDFGVHLRDFVFENLVDSDLSILQQEISSKITAFEPRVNLQSVDLVANPDQNGLQIRIVATLRKDPTQQIVIERFFAGGGE